MDSKIEKMMRVLAGCKIICDFNEELINAVEEVNDVSAIMLKSVDDDITTNNALDTIDERLENLYHHLEYLTSYLCYTHVAADLLDVGNLL